MNKYDKLFHTCVHIIAVFLIVNGGGGYSTIYRNNLESHLLLSGAGLDVYLYLSGVGLDAYFKRVVVGWVSGFSFLWEVYARMVSMFGSHAHFWNAGTDSIISMCL